MAYTVNVNHMPSVDADVDVYSLPPVHVATLPNFAITSIGSMGPLTLSGIPSDYTVAISQLPDLNLRIKEIPQVRAHVPANFRLGLSILGVELAALHLCGEAQVITEPYVPNPCERCNPPRVPTEPRQPVGAVLRLKAE
jgi:hypothetical protein